MGVGWYWELMSPCKNKLLSKFHTRRELLTKLLWIFTLLSVTYRKKPYQSIFSVFSSPTGEFLWVTNAHKKSEKFHLKNILNSSAQSCKMLHNFYYFFRVIHLTSLSRSLTYLPLIHMTSSNLFLPSSLFFLHNYYYFKSTTIAFHSLAVATFECAHSEFGDRIKSVSLKFM